MSTTHDWARELQQTAEFLLSKTEVEIGRLPKSQALFFSDKEPFLNLVRALKPGRKKIDEWYVKFQPAGSEFLELSVNRDLVCRRLNPEYECEPLLSPQEDAEMETASPTVHVSV